jgi:hypothetical protein
MCRMMHANSPILMLMTSHFEISAVSQLTRKYSMIMLNSDGRREADAAHLNVRFDAPFDAQNARDNHGRFRMSQDTEFVRATVVLSEEDKDQLVELAESLGLSTSDLIARALQLLGRAHNKKFGSTRRRGGFRRDVARLHHGFTPPLSDEEALELAADIIKNTVAGGGAG